jgi:hypothetical protein
MLVWPEQVPAYVLRVQLRLEEVHLHWEVYFLPVTSVGLSEQPLVISEKLVGDAEALAEELVAVMAMAEYDELMLTSLVLESAYLPARTPVPAARPMTATPRMPHKTERISTIRGPGPKAPPALRRRAWPRFARPKKRPDLVLEGGGGGLCD